MDKKEEKNSKKVKQKIKEVRRVIKNYFRDFWRKLEKKMSDFLKGMSFSLQLFFSFLFMFILAFGLLIYIHYYCYVNILKYEYSLINSNYTLNSILETQIIKVVELGNHIIESQLENKISDQLFLRVYFRELISRGLLNKTLNNKNIDYKTFTNNIFKNLNDDNYNFELQTDINLSPLEGMFYLFIPLIIKSQKIHDNNLLTTYLITKNIESNSCSYFNFPIEKQLYKDDYKNNESNNNLIDPYICNKTTQTKSEDEEFSKDNWFKNKAIEFEKENYSKNYSKLSFINLSLFISKKLSYSYFQVFQYYLHTSKLYVYIIFKYDKTFKRTLWGIDYNIFALKNSTFQEKNIKKYSDNETYVITENSLVSLGLSKEFLNFFNLGMRRKNNLFYKNGENFDTFDLEYFDNPTKKFIVQNTFLENIRVFTNFLFYSLFFLDINFETFKSDENFINIVDNSSSVYNKCQFFDYGEIFQDIEHYKKNRDFSCLSEEQMYYYNLVNGIENSKYNYIPNINCECIPFYCLNKTIADIKNKKIIFSNKISLPNRCSLSLDSYYSPKTTGKVNKYLKFYWMPFEYLPEISIMIISVVQNEFYTEIKDSFHNQIDQFIRNFIHINFLIYFVIIFVSIAIFLVRFCKFIKIIPQYMKKNEAFLFNIEENNKTRIFISENDEHSPKSHNNEIEQDERENENSYILNERDLAENSALIGDNKKKKHVYSGNTLIDDLFNIYCQYYKIDPNEIIQKDRKKGKEYIKNSILTTMKNKNELFEVLSALSENAAMFKFNISFNINLYEMNELNRHYLKGVKKFSNYNKLKKQLTQGILFELLSTEYITNYGLVMNFRFNYLNNVKKRRNDSIRNALYGNFSLNEYKLIGKRKDDLGILFENSFKFLNDDFNIRNLESAFNYFLIDVYYKYFSQSVNERDDKI